MSRYSPDDDRTLVTAAQSGDRTALETLLRRHHDRIYGVCLRIVGNETDAMDATQDALVAIVRGLPRFDGRAAFSTWTYRIATNTCLDELRRRKRRPAPVDPDRVEVHTTAAREPSSSGGAVDQQIADRLAIGEALRALPEEFRVAVVLRDVGGLDYAEIASILSVPVGTVRSRIARGRAGLARHLGNPTTGASVPTEAP